MQTVGQPTCVLAKTVKGYGLGEAGEGKNPTHQLKKLGEDALRAFRDRYRLPIEDEQIKEAPYYKPPANSPEMEYLHQRRKALGGYVPERRPSDEQLPVPQLNELTPLLESTGEREMSTTSAFVRLLGLLLRNKAIAQRLVPIIPDEARTFGAEGLFRQLGIYASQGQLYEPVDSDQFLYYREDKQGQVLQEGISEAGGMSSFIAAGTAYASYGIQTIPFFAFYSMFGFQRVGDLIWAAADSRARGFLIGATSGRTTLAGEGLQHCDGHSQLLASAVPSCVAYDPTYAYELAVIVQDGLRRMLSEQQNVTYYITVTNENYPQPALPDGAAEGIVKGMYLLRESLTPAPALRGGAPGAAKGPKVQLLGSGAILREVLAASELLQSEHGVQSDVWSVTSFTELAREGASIQRGNRLHPERKPEISYVERCLGLRQGPVIAATDYVRLYADQIRQFVPRRYSVLGTDGFGRSDTRENLRRFFEVDRSSIVVAALSALAAEGAIDASKVSEAIERYGIEPERVAPNEG
jgi:pyruvate dehydrogenase E1 component